MDIRLDGRARAAVLFTLLLTATTAHAAVLLDFDFEYPDGTFTLAPSLRADGIASAVWSDARGLIADFAGQPGRALATSGFTTGNVLMLAVTTAAGLHLAAETLGFDLRVSSSGPTAWRVESAGTLLGEGQATTKFERFAVDLRSLFPGAALTLVLGGSGATAASGTLRLDNVELYGSLQPVPVPVPLPGPLFLLVTPLLGLTLRAGNRRRAGVQPG